MKLLKNTRRILGTVLSLVMMLTLFMWNGVEAEAAVVDQVSVSIVQKYDSGFLKSFKLDYYVGYPQYGAGSLSAQSRVAVHTQPFANDSFTEDGTYAGSHSYTGWVNAPEDCGFVAWGLVDGTETFTRPASGNDHSITVTFSDNAISLNTAQTYYVYVWTYYENSNSNIYPDAYVYEFTAGQGDFTGTITPSNPNPGDSSENTQQPDNNQGTGENKKTYTHTHNFQWVVTKQPTEKTDGCNSLMCEGCGAVEATQPISYFNNITNNVIKEIKEAPEKGTVTIDDEFLRCFSNEMVEELLARPDLTVVVNFMDKGVNYSFTIPAGKAPTDGQEWYGYYYLGSVYGWTSIENAM